MKRKQPVRLIASGLLHIATIVCQERNPRYRFSKRDVTLKVAFETLRLSVKKIPLSKLAVYMRYRYQSVLYGGGAVVKALPFGDREKIAVEFHISVIKSSEVTYSCSMSQGNFNRFLGARAFADDPRFAEPIPNVTVALGRDASLPCVVENLGTYKVAWIHIDRQMILTIHRQVISKIPRFSISHDNIKTWLLHVSRVQKEDRGYYMCQVNTNPMISQVGYLQVVVPPSIIDTQSTQSTIAVRENQNISLTCKADGFPTPKIMWRREDGQSIIVERRQKVNFHNGEYLNLTHINRMDMGAYLCIATNGIPPSVSKRIILDVEFSPMIWVPNQLVGVPAGTDVTIDCHTEAYPRAISYWVYDNVMLLPTKKYGTKTTDNSYRTHMELTVRNLQTKDFGYYRCISKNSLGETEGSIRIYDLPMSSKPSRTREMEIIPNKGSHGRLDIGDRSNPDKKLKIIMVSSPEKEKVDVGPANDSSKRRYTPSAPQNSGRICMAKWALTQVAAVIIHGYLYSTFPPL